MQRRKYVLFIILSLSILTFMISGCSSLSEKDQTIKDENRAFQELYDRSYSAKECADEHINDYLLTLDSNYSIIETAYGFVTAEEPFYIVCYKCSNSVNNLLYGYKIAVDSSGICSILEEGINVNCELLK